MKALAGKYSRFIRWSDEDNCYIGSLPDLKRTAPTGKPWKKSTATFRKWRKCILNVIWKREWNSPSPGP